MEISAARPGLQCCPLEVPSAAVRQTERGTAANTAHPHHQLASASGLRSPPAPKSKPRHNPPGPRAPPLLGLAAFQLEPPGGEIPSSQVMPLTTIDSYDHQQQGSRLQSLGRQQYSRCFLVILEVPAYTSGSPATITVRPCLAIHANLYTSRHEYVMSRLPLTSSYQAITRISRLSETSDSRRRVQAGRGQR